MSYIAVTVGRADTNEIEIMQTKIIKEYKNGVSFDFLAQQYSTDKNANRGGDSGWFS